LAGETVRTFVSKPLPPDPVLEIGPDLPEEIDLALWLVRLHRLGRSSRVIARQLRMDRDTVRCYLRWLRQPGVLDGPAGEILEVGAMRLIVPEHTPSTVGQLPELPRLDGQEAGGLGWPEEQGLRARVEGRPPIWVEFVFSIGMRPGSYGSFGGNPSMEVPWRAKSCGELPVLLDTGPLRM
jgi:hypothetical protein